MKSLKRFHEYVEMKYKENIVDSLTGIVGS
jgi:hypothetical protein